MTDTSSLDPQYIHTFSFLELDKAFKELSNLRSADNEGCVAELFKYANRALKEEILDSFNLFLSMYHLQLSNYHGLVNGTPFLVSLSFLLN